MTQWHEMAERNTILRAPSGSEIYGLNLTPADGEDQASDRDEMGICVEDLSAFGGFSEFEQYIFRSAAAREGQHDAPSQPGDLDLTIYGLRKFLRLAMQGNPSVLPLLFIPPALCVSFDARGSQLQELAPFIISRQAGKRYLGYMESQRQRLMGERGQKKVNRPELEEKYGYDTKYAMHILRLGYQGVELLTTGKLTLPLDDSKGWRTYIKEVRQGKHTLDEVLNTAGQFERELKDLLDTALIDDEPATGRVQEWMLDTYFQWWKCEEFNVKITQRFVEGVKHAKLTGGR